MKNYQLAEHDYILGMKYKDIAEKYNVSVDTVKSWRKRYGWNREKSVKKSAPIAPLNKKGCISEKEVQEEELNDREILFCHYYVKCWNATQAALKSGYSQNKTSAAIQGSKLLSRARVKAEIDRLRSLIRQEIQLDVIDLLQFCLKIVAADIGDYVKFGQKDIPVMGMYGPIIDKQTQKPITQRVSYVALEESDMVDTSVISEVKQGKDGVSIKLADKKWAWEQLIKYFDWFPDRWKRKLEEDKLKMAQEKLQAEINKTGNKDSDKQIEIFIKRKGRGNDSG